MLGDRGIDHAPRAELLQQALRDLVGALIFRDLFAHHEHVAVAPHLLGHRIAQRFADGLGDHLGAGRDFRIGLGDGRRPGWVGGAEIIGLPSPTGERDSATSF